MVGDGEVRGMEIGRRQQSDAGRCRLVRTFLDSHRPVSSTASTTTAGTTSATAATTTAAAAATASSSSKRSSSK